jgi:hypothetical protein
MPQRYNARSLAYSANTLLHAVIEVWALTPDDWKTWRERWARSTAAKTLRLTVMDGNATAAGLPRRQLSYGRHRLAP